VNEDRLSNFLAAAAYLATSGQRCGVSMRNRKPAL
jgi:hypothetical protein